MSDHKPIFPVRLLRTFCPPHLLEVIEGRQNFSKNSLGKRMEMFSNGFRTSKSGSPVMMQLALPERASSRHLLSFGSRHAETLCDGTIHSMIFVYRLMISMRASIGLKYRSNFFLKIVSESSSRVSLEASKVWSCSAFLTAEAVIPEGESAAPITALQSKTERIYSFFKSSVSLSSVRPCLLACSAVNSNKSLSDCEEVTRSTQIFRSISRFSLATLLNFLANSSSNSMVSVFIFQRY